MRALATLTLTFGLVSIPVKLYAATERAASIRFRLMSARGGRTRQQYVEDALPVAEAPAAWENDEEPPDEPPSRPAAATRRPVVPAQRSAPVAEAPLAAPMSVPSSAHAPVVARHDLVKGYEFEKGKFVLFSPAELKALQEGARESIDIVSFIPLDAVDPIYFDKAYLLAPDRRGERPYALLLAALQRSRRSALAKWAWRGKQYVVQVRPADGGLVLQQLRYADEVRAVKDLDIPLAQVADAELQLALQLVEQASQPSFDPSQFVDEEKQRILDAVERKIAGREVIESRPATTPAGAQIIDLMEALRASLRAPQDSPLAVPAKRSGEKARKPARASGQPVPGGRKKAGGR